MIKTYRKILTLLNARERRQFFLLMGMVLLMGIFEAAGVASILPFLRIVSDPAVIETNETLAWAYQLTGASSPQNFMVLCGGLVFFVVVFGLLFKTLTLYALTRFSLMRSYTLSARLLRGYLHQPYAWFMNRHSAELSKTVLTEVAIVNSRCILPAMNVMANVTVVILVAGLLFVLEPAIAIGATLLLGGSYAVIFLLLKNFLTHIGHERVKANKERFHIAQEALGGIKEMKVMGLEEGFLSRFRIPARRMSEYQTLGQVLSQLPRYVLEAIAFGGIIALILVLIIRDEGGLVAMLPTLGLVAMAGTRLFPALQKVFHSISSMRFGEPALDALYKDIMEVSPAVSDAARLRKPRPPMELRDTLALEAASFTYPEAPRPALDAMTLEIPANHTIGIVGGTGAGKTSVVDVILGLLTLQSGALRVDGHAVTDEDIRAWQKNIGYVPQQIFLADDTVSANIAFGTPAEKIDQAAVERAARIAELHDFVTETLPEGYDTRVGERGVKLSGGQRQRIGIARALYHDPGVLILDEATSALDNLTEQAVMEAVHNLGRQKTIIMIAHRLSTVKACDRIFYLEAGRVAQSGTYDELVSESAGFRAMSEAG